MKALCLESSGLETLRVADLPDPEPAAGQVLLRMRAAAVGLRDYKVVAGAYRADAQTRPLIPGGEGVGEVIALGAGVAGLAPGTRVHPLYYQGWIDGRPAPELLARGTLGGPLLHGTFAEYMVVPVDSVVPVPEHIADAAAATLPFTGLTAWRAVAEQGGIAAGDVVMIQGTGGVPLLALQFAKALGATVIVSSKSDDRLARARALGADHTINYREAPEWAGVVRELTGGMGADLVLDPGGSVTLAQSIRAVRPGGTISVFNALSSADIDVHLPYLLGHSVAIHGVNGGSRASHEAMLELVHQARIQPVVESVVPLADAVAAVADAPAAARFGKPCIQI